MRSILIFANPAARSARISSATISAVCLRPVRASSRGMKDCTPRLTRFIPALTHASGKLQSYSTWRNFDGRLPPRAARYCRQDSIQIGRLQTAGRATAQVNRLRLPGPIRGRDLGAKRGQVISLQLSRKHSRGEITIRALLRAKRIGDVNAGHLQRNFFSQLLADGVLDQLGQRLAGGRKYKRAFARCPNPICSSWSAPKPRSA